MPVEGAVGGGRWSKSLSFKENSKQNIKWKFYFIFQRSTSYNVLPLIYPLFFMWKIFYWTILLIQFSSVHYTFDHLLCSKHSSRETKMSKNQSPLSSSLWLSPKGVPERVAVSLKGHNNTKTLFVFITVLTCQWWYKEVVNKTAGVSAPFRAVAPNCAGNRILPCTYRIKIVSFT